MDPFAPHKQEVDQQYENTLKLDNSGRMGIYKLWFAEVGLWIQNIPLVAQSVECHAKTWSGIDAQPYIWSLLPVAIVGLIIEEVVFRGVIFYDLEKIRSGGTIILSGIMSVLWHEEPVQCVFAAIIGIAFGVVYDKTKDLKILIALHFLINVLAFLPPCIDCDGGQTFLGCASLIMVVPTAVILVRMSRGITQKKLHLTEESDAD